MAMGMGAEGRAGTIQSAQVHMTCSVVAGFASLASCVNHQYREYR